MKSNNIKFSNGDLFFEIEKIIDNQRSLEETNEKMAVSKVTDFNLDYPYGIDVEDTSYFYINENDRDTDYKIICEILSKKSKKFLY